MKSWTDIFRDTRLLIPLAFFLCWEGCLQLGLYAPLLRPRSYAGNVERIMRTIKGSKLQPDLLILGTSVAYQGVNVELLNQLLEKEGLVVQSAASEGAILVTQHSLYRELAPHLKNLRGIIHVTELTFPWTARRLIDPSNRSMVAQINRFRAFELLERHEFRLSAQDRAFLLIRSITYQQDIREFVTNPLRRFKELGKIREGAHPDFAYINREKFRLSAYPANDLGECMDVATKGVKEFNEAGQRITDNHHRQAVWRTCEVAVRDPLTQSGYSQWNALFFRQMARIHQDAHERNHQVFTVLPPYSDLIPGLNADWRLEHWQEGLKSVPGTPVLIDLRGSLDGPQNRDYYYDTIHLNEEGSIRFTRALAHSIREEILPRLKN
ncbi:MAG: hypothetical protein HS115_19655 [Spirochaetales bacterium]|nr:hypothetical protein [Spirochaetales bacterium]